MKYLWADTAIDNDYYFYIADASNNVRAFGSHTLILAVHRYIDNNLCVHFNINIEDKPMLPWEFLE